MTGSAPQLNRTAAGLAALLLALNVQWLASTAGLLEVLLFRDEEWTPVLDTALAVLLLISAAGSVIGLALCLALPVRAGARAARGAALGLALLALLAGVAGLVPALRPWLAPDESPFHPYEHLLPLLTAGALAAAHLTALGFLHGLARSLDQERLAARAVQIAKLAAALVGLAAAVWFGASMRGLLAGAVLTWFGGLAWMFLYGFLLLHLNEAARHAADLRAGTVKPPGSRAAAGE